MYNHEKPFGIEARLHASALIFRRICLRVNARVYWAKNHIIDGMMPGWHQPTNE